MATLPRTKTFVIDSNDVYSIGDADDGFVGTYAVHFVNSSAPVFDGEVTVGIRAYQLGVSAATPAFLPIPYLPLNTGGTAATYATGSSAAITGTGYILIPASGGVVALTCASWTEGSLTCYVTPLLGAAA